MANFIILDQWGAPKARWEDAVQRDTRAEGMQETGNTQGRMETSSQGGQGPEGAVAPWEKKKKKISVSKFHELVPVVENEDLH